MILILADADGSGPLLLSGSQGAERGAKLLELPSVLRPVAGSLRGDRAVVMSLRLPKQIADCA